MPSNVSMTSPNASGNSTIPATPLDSTPSSSGHPAPTAPWHTPSSSGHTCIKDDQDKKWVINLSKTPSPQNSYPFYKKGPDFPITPKYHPMEAYITVVEEAASKLPSTEADVLRSDTSSLLRCHNHHHNNHSNLNPAQCTALTQLKQDTSRVVLTADKGVAMVIMASKITTTRSTLYFKTPTHTEFPPQTSKTN